MGSTRHSSYTNSSAVLGTSKISASTSSVLCWVFLIRVRIITFTLTFTIALHIPLCQHASEPGSGKVTAGREQCSTFSLESALRYSPGAPLGTPARPSPNKPEIAWAGTHSALLVSAVCWQLLACSPSETQTSTWGAEWKKNFCLQGSG